MVVHGYDDACAALRAAGEAGRSIILVSAPGAAAYGGPGWFAQLVAQAAEAVPGVPHRAILDCGDKPGHVLAALRAGLWAVQFKGDPEVAVRLEEIARQYGARIETGPLEALDLRGTESAEQDCRDWLVGR